MPEISYTATMNAPRARVWEFVRDMSNWAPFTHGYQSHEELNERESVWTVKADLGPISRITSVHVTITEWVEGERVAFTITGRNEPVTGEGAIQLSDEAGAARTEIRGEAVVQFGGSLGPVMNELIVPFIRSGADELVTKIVLAITGEQPVSRTRRVFIFEFAAALWSALVAALRSLGRAAAGLLPRRRGGQT